MKHRYLTKLVYSILTHDKASRDDWMIVIKEVHERELPMWGYTKETYFDAFFNNKLSNVQTITRIWRVIQEKCPELRGENWAERQAQAGLIASEFVSEKDIQITLFNNDKN